MTAGAGSAFFVFFGVVGWVIFMGFHIGEYGIRVDTCGITIIYINMLYIYCVYIYMMMINHLGLDRPHCDLEISL